MTCEKCHDTGLVDIGDKAITCHACSRYWLAMLDMDEGREKHDPAHV